MNLGRGGVLVAARTLSTRLPGKALLPLHGLPMIVFLLRRLKAMKHADLFVVTTTLAADDRLAEAVEAENVPVFRGADADVVKRYVDAAAHFGLDTVARITADCPFVDAELVDYCMQYAENAPDFDLATTKGQFPVGLDVEIYPAAAMAALHRSGTLTAWQREHLTLYYYDNPAPGRLLRVPPPASWPQTSRHFTVDTQEDYEAAIALTDRLQAADFQIPDLLVSAR